MNIPGRETGGRGTMGMQVGEIAAQERLLYLATLCVMPLSLQTSSSSCPAHSADHFMLVRPHGTVPHFVVIELFSQRAKG